MKEFWDQRYSEQDYVYGQQPNEYLRHFLETENLRSGRILLPGEGEGRNAVYAARKGWEAIAFDQSLVGREKAMRLAAENNVYLRYDVCDVRDFSFEDNTYDLIGLFFFHLPPDLRAWAHERFVAALRPGGMLVAELFTPAQLGKPSGGPKSLELLYDAPSLGADFDKLNIRYLAEEKIYLREGKYHQGEAEVARLIAQKPLHGTL